MNKTLLLILALAFASASYAQPPKGNDGKGKPHHHDDSDSTRKLWQEQIHARKAAYFTTQIDLTGEEAQAFWPIYNDFWKRRNKLFDERNNILHKVRHDKVDDKKAAQLTQRLIENLQDDVNLAREYNDKFAKVLPPLKLLKYHQAEESFKRELIKVLREPQKP
ncbi:MAG: hypothetical protein LBS94_00730 [Prevotellaceae bacterium]|jgi:Spy/CpxP family protein refolding chaperone|nr:hypothetical protein [Prevotellaceae bacterium]